MVSEFILSRSMYIEKKSSLLLVVASSDTMRFSKNRCVECKVGEEGDDEFEGNNSSSLMVELDLHSD